jgi:hypothetical protein
MGCGASTDLAQNSVEPVGGGGRGGGGVESTRSSACAIPTDDETDVLDAVEELPQRSMAVAALCTLIASAHFESTTTISEGALVPPPLVGCLMWLLRDEFRCGPWMEPPGLLAATPYPRMLLDDKLNRAAAQRIGPLRRAVLDAQMSFVLEPPAGGPVRCCPKGAQCRRTVQLVTANSAALGVMAHRDRRCADFADSFVLTFDGFARLTLEHAPPDSWTTTVDAKDDLPVSFLWQRQFAAVNLRPPPPAVAFATPAEEDEGIKTEEEGERDVAVVDGDPDEALRTLNDLAVVFGFRPQISYQCATGGGARLSSAHPAVVSSPASELVRCLGDSVSPMSLESFGRLFTPDFDRELYNEQLKERNK